MDRLTDLADVSIGNYFKTLSTFGYKGYREVDKLLVLLYIEELLTGPFSLYVTEGDYRTIVNVLYCLFDSTCLIPYPEFSVNTSLVQDFSAFTPRITEDSNLRVDSEELIRLTEY